MKQQHVVIVGGGLIGLSAAWALLRDGHRVTIVERDTLGSGAATGNAGELTPQQVSPLASANTAKDIVRGVFTKSSYLSIDALKLPQLAGFGIGFLRSSGASRLARGSASLAQFSGEILPSLHRMSDDGIDISGGGNGYLMTCSIEPLLVAAHAGYQRRAELGWGEAPGQILRGAALAEHEPVLDPNVTGGFMLPGEFSLDPVSFVASLAAHIEREGASIRTGLTALRLTPHRTEAGAGIICSDESGREVTVTGDRVVIAAGAWTSPILRRSAIRAAPIVSGKGYSYTVPIDHMPNTLIHSLDRHCVVIPMHERLRIVGMMEFDGSPAKLNRQRFDVLTKAASGLITGAQWEARTDEWVGARPMTADGMPLLGPVAGRPEVIVAAGHNMHGLSLGPVTGEVIADLIAGRETTAGGTRVDLTPFAVRR
ncbi:MAG: NAD(P)/FAD-dependent oxidoreductase [Leucobacter sp.]